MTVTVVVEYLKVIDIGPRHIIKKKRKNSIFRYSFVKLPWNTSNLIFSFFFFFLYNPTDQPILSLFFSSTLVITYQLYRSMVN